MTAIMVQSKARCTKILILLACTALIAVHGEEPASAPEPAAAGPAGSGISLGALTGGAHDCAGDVKILDETTIEITGLKYDGEGPAAYFVVSSNENTMMMTGMPKNNIRPVFVAKEEGKTCTEKPGKFTGDAKSLKFKLAKGQKVQSYKYFALYCLKFNNVFCYVKIKEGSTPAAGTSTEDECKPQYIDGDGEDSSSGRLVLPMGLILFSSLSVISFGRSP